MIQALKCIGLQIMHYSKHVLSIVFSKELLRHLPLFIDNLPRNHNLLAFYCLFHLETALKCLFKGELATHAKHLPSTQEGCTRVVPAT